MRYLALLIMSCMALPSYALTQVNIFSSEVVIDEEGKEPEVTARKQGMQEVLVRATGNTDVVNNETVQKALRQSAQYLSQMSYGEQEEASTLKMRFNAAQIRSLLTQAQLPYWPENRANILVWLVEEQNYDRSIAWEHSDSNLRRSIIENSQRRGLPVTLPVGDFDDITGIAVSDLWGSFVGPISASSQRYPVDAVLVIRSQRQGMRWTLYDQKPNLIVDSPKTPITGSVSGNSATQAQALIDEVSNYYAGKSAVTVASESSESQLVQFMNVSDAQDFFELENGLKALNSVASLDILKIQNNEVTFRIHLLSSPEEFKAELRRIRQLAEMELEVVEPEIAPEFESQENTVVVEAEETSSTQSEVLSENPTVSSDVTESEASSIESVDTQSNETTALETTEVISAEQVLTYEWIKN
ncbi:DUF2066 domain-containing protein [Vibrio profundi]|uniref:DUF2066 domain-containing protein n=1 Tax=Vibrio profundi TaxID=1774960 RepID=UPI0037350397